MSCLSGYVAILPNFFKPLAFIEIQLKSRSESFKVLKSIKLFYIPKTISVKIFYPIEGVNPAGITPAYHL